MDLHFHKTTAESFSSFTAELTFFKSKGFHLSFPLKYFKYA